MKVHEALSETVAANGWSATKLAAEFGVTEAAARRWLTGETVPAGHTLIRLQKELPGFSERLGLGSVPAAEARHAS